MSQHQPKPQPDPALYQFFLGQLPEFDQIVKGNVCIKKLSKYGYRITFSKIGKFLMYQVWNKDDANKQNDNRVVKYVSAKEWVTLFKKINNNILKENKKPLFTPTTVMETENNIYAFVIHKACLNSCDKVVFTVSTKEISLQNNTSKKLVQLPLGKCNDVRFDIDNSIFPIVDDFICLKNKFTEELSKNYKISITQDRDHSDGFYEAYSVNGNIPLETLKTFLSYSEIETKNPNDNSYVVGGLIYGSSTILLSKGVENNSYAIFSINEGIVKYFWISKSTFDNDNTIPIFDSISFIKRQNIVCP